MPFQSYLMVGSISSLTKVSHMLSHKIKKYTRMTMTIRQTSSSKVRIVAIQEKWFWSKPGKMSIPLELSSSISWCYMLSLQLLLKWQGKWSRMEDGSAQFFPSYRECANRGRKATSMASKQCKIRHQDTGNRNRMMLRLRECVSLLSQGSRRKRLHCKMLGCTLLSGITRSCPLQHRFCKIHSNEITESNKNITVISSFQ